MHIQYTPVLCQDNRFIGYPKTCALLPQSYVLSSQQMRSLRLDCLSWLWSYAESIRLFQRLLVASYLTNSS